MAAPEIQTRSDILWSGENPIILLKPSADAQETTATGFFRVDYSPSGSGHAVFVISDLGGRGDAADRVFACYTDNESLAAWIRGNSIGQLPEFQNHDLSAIPIKAGRFASMGDTRRSWTEIVSTEDGELRLTWSKLLPPFNLVLPVGVVDTIKHEISTVLYPGRRSRGRHERPQRSGAGAAGSDRRHAPQHGIPGAERDVVHLTRTARGTAQPRNDAMSRYGFHGRLLRVDLGRKTYAGSRNRRTCSTASPAAPACSPPVCSWRERPPGIDPLGPENLLIFANSAVSGYPLAGLVRHVVCAKSPLTGGIGETRVEGPWGIALKRTGYDALVFHSAADRPYWPPDRRRRGDVLRRCGAVGADDGQGDGRSGEPVWQRRRDRRHRPGRREQGALRQHRQRPYPPGPALGNGSGDGREEAEGDRSQGRRGAASRGRGDLPRASAPSSRPPFPTTFWQAGRRSGPVLPFWVHDHGIDAALDVNNFRTATFERVDNYDKPHWAPHYRGVAPCPGCANDCMKVYHVQGQGDVRASAMHQEVTGAMGPNIGTPDVATLIAYNTRLNELGMDPVSLGFTLSLAMELMERGILSAGDLDGLDLRFGNVEATRAMIERIALRQGAGDLLAEGAKRAAARIGDGAERYAMHVKGLGDGALRAAQPGQSRDRLRRGVDRPPSRHLRA